MVEYLICFLEPDGRVGRTVSIYFDNEQRAIDYVADIDYANVVELWAGNRMVKRFDPRIN